MGIKMRRRAQLSLLLHPIPAQTPYTKKHIAPPIERIPLPKLHVQDTKQYLVFIFPLIQTLAILRDCPDVVQTLSLPLGIAPHCEAHKDLAKEQTHYPSLSIPRQIRQQRRDNSSWEPIFARQ